MQKLIVMLLFLGLGTLSASSQTVGTITSYNKKNRSALLLQLPYDVSIAEGFILDHLKNAGYSPEEKGSLFWKTNKSNGYLLFKNVKLQGAAEGLDLYFKVETKSKVEQDQSLVYLLISKGGEDFVTATGDKEIYNAGQRFMNDFVPYVAVYKLQQDVNNQEKQVTSEEKKLEALKNEREKLEKKIADLQLQLQNNATRQQAQQQAIDGAKKQLEQVKAKAAAQ